MAHHPYPPGIPAPEADAVREICRLAWKRRLLSGFNGNVSVRLEDGGMLITRSGAAKGYLDENGFCRVRIADGALLAGEKPSSEGGMHLAVYRARPEARAVVHTHPPRLLALGLLLPWEKRLDIPVYEAQALRGELARVPDYEPGTTALAEAAGEAARTGKALWMERHGLAVWGGDLVSALALSEELEHLADVQLRAMRACDHAAGKP